MAFGIVESTRYPYYFLKSRGNGNTFLGKLFGHFRYTFFIVCYPLGAFGEIMIALSCVHLLQSTNPKPFSIMMPNAWNFVFDLEYYIYTIPLQYVYGFPMNYMYMWRQRKSYYTPAVETEKKHN
jgi:hypothetical protein